MTSQLAPSVGLAEAARLTGKSVSTIRRKKTHLQSLGATVAEDGWAIPIPALVQLGLLDKVTPPEGGMTGPMTPPENSGGITREVEELRARLAEVEHRAALAEAIAEERLHRIDDLRQSLLMLEAAKPAAAPVPENPPAAPTKRRWWQRGE